MKARKNFASIPVVRGESKSYEIDRMRFNELCNLRQATGRPVRALLREAICEYLAGRRWLVTDLPRPHIPIKVLTRAIQ